jgi:CheY-like chemotaxis protein
VLAAILSERDRVVDTAREGIEAVALIGQNQYDLILSDLSMPGLDGPALYDALRSIHHVTSPRVIFMTGHAAGGDYAEFLKGTTEPILEKPFKVGRGAELGERALEAVTTSGLTLGLKLDDAAHANSPAGANMRQCPLTTT